jgi:hypothetical protein
MWLCVFPEETQPKLELIPWSRILLERMIVAKLVRKLLICYETR